jgi:hypothetical protein
MIGPSSPTPSISVGERITDIAMPPPGPEGAASAERCQPAVELSADSMHFLQVPAIVATDTPKEQRDAQ